MKKLHAYSRLEVDDPAIVADTKHLLEKVQVNFYGGNFQFLGEKYESSAGHRKLVSCCDKKNCH